MSGESLTFIPVTLRLWDRAGPFRGAFSQTRGFASVSTVPQRALCRGGGDRELLQGDKQPQEESQNDLPGLEFQPGKASRFLDKKRKEWTVLHDLHVEL